jgi:hypothetical protein
MVTRDKEAMLRHFLAALAYRTQKAVRAAPDGFAEFEPGNLIRTPKELVRHMTSVLGYARTFFIGGQYRPEPLPAFQDEVQRLHDVIRDLSEHIACGDELSGVTPEQLLQGPLSDAMTHAGQLALLRRLYGAPIPPENFVFADVDPANLSVDQPLPRYPDAEWPEKL